MLSSLAHTIPGKFQDVTFSMRAGEILGFAGLDSRATGTVELNGQPLALGSVKASRTA